MQRFGYYLCRDAAQFIQKSTKESEMKALCGGGTLRGDGYAAVPALGAVAYGHARDTGKLPNLATRDKKYVTQTLETGTAERESHSSAYLYRHANHICHIKN